jgi:hypothetical protein
MQLHLAILKNLSKLNVGVEFLREKYIDDEINHLNKYEQKCDDDDDQQRSTATTVFSYIKSEQSNLTKNDILNLETFDVDDNNYRIKSYSQSFKYAYKQMDKLLARGKNEKSIKRWSGATACTCIIENSASSDDLVTDSPSSDAWIHISNCGILFLNFQLPNIIYFFIK